MTIRAYYRYKQVNVSNLVSFGSIVLFNGNCYITIYDQIVNIFFNFRIKRVGFTSSKLIPGYCMFGIMAQSSRYIFREFHEN